MNLTKHLARQMAFSRATFGPGAREQGVCDHIRKELIEIGGEPPESDLEQLVRRYIRPDKDVFAQGALHRLIEDELARRTQAREEGPAPDDGDKAKEWVDVVLLALDGLWRALSASGCRWIEIPKRAVYLIRLKQAKNEQRNWPDWRTADPNKAIEHDRSGEAGGSLN